MNITKEVFEYLYDPNILKKEFDAIIFHIDKRFSDIVVMLYPDITTNGNWFVYENYDYDSETDSGYFDINNYKEFIAIGGKYNFPEPYCLTDAGIGYIHTRWLWTDDAEILKEYKNAVENYNKINEELKKKKLQKKQTDKTKKLEMKKIISSKLSKEEMKYIKFK